MQLVEADFRRITHQLRGIYRMYLNFIKENRRMLPIELGNYTRILTDYAAE